MHPSSSYGGGHSGGRPPPPPQRGYAYPALSYSASSRGGRGGVDQPDARGGHPSSLSAGSSLESRRPSSGGGARAVGGPKIGLVRNGPSTSLPSLARHGSNTSLSTSTASRTPNQPVYLSPPPSSLSSSRPSTASSYASSSGLSPYPTSPRPLGPSPSPTYLHPSSSSTSTTHRALSPYSTPNTPLSPLSPTSSAIGSPPSRYHLAHASSASSSSTTLQKPVYPGLGQKRERPPFEGHSRGMSDGRYGRY
ncbi:hypothetical protein JCM11251_000117 [Rhodosporidiobolus azoricus]